MKEIPEFNIYIKPGCPWCIEVIDYLNQHNYAYQTIDVRADPSAFDEMKAISGQTSAPTMTVGDLMLADFGVEELVPFLTEHNLLLD